MSEARSQIARYLQERGRKPDAGNISEVLRALQSNPGLIPSLVVGPTEDSGRGGGIRGEPAPTTRRAEPSPIPSPQAAPAATSQPPAAPAPAPAPTSYTPPARARPSEIGLDPVSAQTNPASASSGGIVDSILSGLGLTGPGTAARAAASAPVGAGAAQAEIARNPLLQTPDPVSGASPPGDPPAITMDGIQRALSTADAPGGGGADRSNPLLGPIPNSIIDLAQRAIGGVSSARDSVIDAARSGLNSIDQYRGFGNRAITPPQPPPTYQGSDATAGELKPPQPPGIGGAVRSLADTVTSGVRGEPGPAVEEPPPPGTAPMLPPAVRGIGRDLASGAQPVIDAATGAGYQRPDTTGANRAPLGVQQFINDPRETILRLLYGAPGMVRPPRFNDQSPGRTPRQPPSNQ